MTDRTMPRTRAQGLKIEEPDTGDDRGHREREKKDDEERADDRQDRNGHRRLLGIGGGADDAGGAADADHHQRGDDQPDDTDPDIQDAEDADVRVHLAFVFLQFVLLRAGRDIVELDLRLVLRAPVFVVVVQACRPGVP